MVLSLGIAISDLETEGQSPGRWVLVGPRPWPRADQLRGGARQCSDGSTTVARLPLVVALTTPS